MAELNEAFPSRTASTSLPGGHVRDIALTIADARRDYDPLVPNDTIPHLVAGYGSGYREVLELARSRRDWCRRVPAESPDAAAVIMRSECGWTEDRAHREIGELKHFYL
jgi:hypothetical protein